MPKDPQVELVNTEEEIDSDEEEINILLKETRREKPKCWQRVLKYTLLLIATVLLAAMCIQLWTSYGTVITEQVFPPRLVGAGEFCADGQKSSYRLHFHKYENKTLHVNIPRTDVLPFIAPYKNYTLHEAHDDSEACIQVSTVDCVSILLYTI